MCLLNNFLNYFTSTKHKIPQLEKELAELEAKETVPRHERLTQE